MGELVKPTADKPGDPVTPAPDGAAGTPATETAAGENNAPPQQSAEELLAELEDTRLALKKANGEAAGNRIELKKIQDAQTAAARKDMDEVDRLKAEIADLADAAQARDALQTQVETYETAVTAQVDAMLKQLKVPAYVASLMETMTPADKLAYLAANQKHFAASPPPEKPNIDSQSGGSAAPKKKELDDDRKKALRRRFRLG